MVLELESMSTVHAVDQTGGDAENEPSQQAVVPGALNDRVSSREGGALLIDLQGF